MSTIDFKLIGITTVLGIIYTAIASIGIKRFNDCKEIQGIAKYANRKMYLSHTLTMLLTIPLAFMMLKFGSMTPNATGFLTMISGILGIIASVFAFQIQKAAECEKSVKKDDKNFIIVAITASVLMTVGGIGMIAFTNKDKILAARNYAKARYNSMRAPAPAAPPAAPAASAQNLTTTTI